MTSAFERISLQASGSSILKSSPVGDAALARPIPRTTGLPALDGKNVLIKASHGENPGRASENGSHLATSEWDIDAAQEPASFPLLSYDPEIEWVISDAPPVVVLKDSWPLESHTDEGQMFHDLNGKFGLPVVLCTYDVKGTEGTTGRTDELIPDDSTYWNVFNFGRSEQFKPEKRRHRRVILKTEGISLLDAQGPRSLIEGIVHAMLGEFLWFVITANSSTGRRLTRTLCYVQRWMVAP